MARRTTLGAEGCAEKAILLTDAAINRRANNIFRLLGDRTAKEWFVAAERAWLSYRKKICISISDVYRGGSAEPLAFTTCVRDRNPRHLEELASFERYLHRIKSK
jgi:uncharacterized protein YecT (DUF1311 family)